MLSIETQGVSILTDLHIYLDRPSFDITRIVPERYSRLATICESKYRSGFGWSAFRPDFESTSTGIESTSSVELYEIKNANTLYVHLEEYPLLSAFVFTHIF
jgi:hypothetical protein